VPRGTDPRGECQNLLRTTVSQGDSELTVRADETPAEVTLSVESANPGVRCRVYQYIGDAGYFTCGVEFPKSALEPESA